MYYLKCYVYVYFFEILMVLVGFSFVVRGYGVCF